MSVELMPVDQTVTIGANPVDQTKTFTVKSLVAPPPAVPWLKVLAPIIFGSVIFAFTRKR
jgi:hypothetical protein